MSMEQVKKINVNFMLLNQVCLLASYGRQDFSDLGLDDHKLQRLTSMSPQELERFAHSLGDTFLCINIAPLDRVFNGITSLPDICKLFLECGASNRAMNDLLGIYDESLCAKWRSLCDVKYRQRSIPFNKYKNVWDLLMKLPNPYKPQPEELIRIADECQVSIGAIWCDILEEVNNHGKK